MASPATHDVTQLLLAWSQGDQTALAGLTPLVHDELHRLAKRYMAGEAPGHVLQTTALVNEAYLRLVDASGLAYRNRTHFFAVSARIMRHILVDFARARRNLKRGGDLRWVPLEDAGEIGAVPRPDLLALDDALSALEGVDAGGES